MTFIIHSIGGDLLNIARTIGYRATPYSYTVEGETNFVRSLSNNNYPRFHIYIKQNEKTGEMVFNLHLDQRQTRYKGASAHSADYEGDLVEKEAERIRNTLQRL